jgi:dihydrofolate synthase/folylpolyglutamate synthase
VDYQEAISYLEGHIGLGMKPGLERTSRLLEMMADPHHGYPAVHITGSNGKTSTARIATSILAAHGLAVGTYTSPHLEHWEERFSLEGKSATPEEFAAAISEAAPFVELLRRETGDPASIFEILTVAAFAWFAERAVDVAVVEVGLGGRLDSTNVLRSEVAVVTGVSREHTQVLGDSVGEIAVEKLAIAKEGSVLVTGPLAEEAERVAAARVEQTAIPWRRFGTNFEIVDAQQAVRGWLCEVSGMYETYAGVPLRMHGRHQTRNLAVAVAACEELFGRALSPEATRRGAERAPSQGRLEVVGRRPLVLLDGAHNPESFAALGLALQEEFPAYRWQLVLGALGDKDLPNMLDGLRVEVTDVYATAPVSERARPVTEISAAARKAFGNAVHEVPSVPEAVTRALATAGPEGAVLVTGSLYVVGEARSTLAPDQAGGLVVATIAEPVFPPPSGEG